MYAGGQATDDDPDFCGKENLVDRDRDSRRRIGKAIVIIKYKHWSSHYAMNHDNQQSPMYGERLGSEIRRPARKYIKP